MPREPDPTPRLLPREDEDAAGGPLVGVTEAAGLARAVVLALGRVVLGLLVAEEVHGGAMDRIKVARAPDRDERGQTRHDDEGARLHAQNSRSTPTEP